MGFPIQGAVALVTGANRGIGEALVNALFAAGARKVYAGARQVSDLTDLQARHGEKLVAVTLDVTQADDVAKAVELAGDVSLLINNAGVVSHIGNSFTDQKWLEVGQTEMDVNYFGTLRMMMAFAPVLASNGGGAIANIGSVASLINFPAFISYSASKAATHSVTQAARLLLAGQGTQVYGIYPGPIDTRMTQDLPFEKTSPAAAATAMLNDIQNGVEEIFPDPMAKVFGDLWVKQPKALESHVAAMLAA